MLQHLATLRPHLFLLVAAFALLGMISASPIRAQDVSAKQFLQAIYKNYTGAHAPGVNFSTAETASRYFEASVAEKILKQDPDSEYEGGGLGFDPFANGQEIDIKSVEITVKSETEARAQAVAAFRNAGRKQAVTYDLVKTSKGWRIANIAWQGAKETLLSILAHRP